MAVAAYNQFANKHKLKKITSEEVESLRRLSIVERCRFLNVPLYKLAFWAGEFYDLYRQSLKQVRLFDGIKELLAELNQRGFHLAIISSNSECNIRAFLQKHQVDDIGQILCSNQIFGKHKVIAKFLKTTKVTHSEVIYVGDEQRDIVACKKMGIKIIWVKWGFDLVDLVKKESPDYMADTPGEILDIVQAESIA